MREHLNKVGELERADLTFKFAAPVFALPALIAAKMDVVTFLNLLAKIHKQIAN